MPSITQTIADRPNSAIALPPPTLHQQVSQIEAEAGDIQHTDDDPGSGRDQQDLQHRMSGSRDAAQDIHHTRSPSLIADQQGAGTQDQRGPKSGAFRLIALPEQQIDQQREGKGEVNPDNDLASRWHLITRDRGDAKFRSFKISLNEQRNVVQDRRYQRGKHDLRIGDSQKLGHQKRRSTHHRWHQLPAGRSDGLDCPGFVGWIAIALDHRDCHDAGGGNICHGRARD